MAEMQTGNPVFDYRAAFRATADRLQRIMLFGGLALFAIGGGVSLCSAANEALRLAACLAGLTGILLCLLGVAWGFYWRRRLRAEFRKLYGPPS
ncbi:MAG: hypothetical protein NTW87_31990 [Planctomycetota bacterium]|nr:hypothetical protein [Planctomycetota bacterium]